CTDYYTKSTGTHENFRLSSRSLAHKRHVWESVGGYPEDMRVAEDTEFDLRICRAGFRETFEPDAKVFWNVKTRYRGYFYQYYRYARSAGFKLQNPKRYLVRLVFYVSILVCLVLGAVLSPWFTLLAVLQLTAYVAGRILRKERARKNLTVPNAWRFIMLVLT